MKTCYLVTKAVDECNDSAALWDRLSQILGEIASIEDSVPVRLEEIAETTP